MRSAAIADGLAHLDPSALVKLVIEEPESAALRAFLDSRLARASSELALTEAPRAIRRAAVGDPGAEAEALVATSTRCSPAWC